MRALRNLPPARPAHLAHSPAALPFPCRCPSGWEKSSSFSWTSSPVALTNTWCHPSRPLLPSDMWGRGASGGHTRQRLSSLRFPHSPLSTCLCSLCPISSFWVPARPPLPFLLLPVPPSSPPPCPWKDPLPVSPRSWAGQEGVGGVSWSHSSCPAVTLA